MGDSGTQAWDRRTTEIVRVSPGELTVAEVIDIVETGGRVIVDVMVVGERKDATLRKSRNRYYCDTGTKLFIHDSQAAFRDCLHEHGLAHKEPTLIADLTAD